MEQLSLFEKFGILFDNIFQHPLFILILLVPVIMFLLQKKHGKKAFVFVYLIVIVLVLLVGGEVIFELFDNLMDGLFMTLYFPNFITLFVAIVLCSIIALFSFFSRKMYKVNKIINIAGFAIIQMLFLLILSLVKAKNIDIYADNALYSNSDVLTLMQLLIGTFTLQIISILIINAINKVTDILDKKSTPLASDINDEIKVLEKSKGSLGLIKNIKIDNTKVGYINAADKSETSKPLLKPFKFDVDKLESITLNIDMPSINSDVLEKEHIKEKPVLLPKERSKPVKFISKKDKVIKPRLIEKAKNKVTKFTFKSKVSEVKPLEKESLVHDTSKFINKQVLETPVLEKPDLLTPEVSPIKVIKEVSHPKLVRKEEREDLVDNLNIVDIQSTLDVAVRFHLMKGVNLESYNDKAAVDNLQIPDFEFMVQVFSKYKLYKK